MKLEEFSSTLIAKFKNLLSRPRFFKMYCMAAKAREAERLSEINCDAVEYIWKFGLEEKKKFLFFTDFTGFIVLIFLKNK